MRSRPRFASEVGAMRNDKSNRDVSSSRRTVMRSLKLICFALCVLIPSDIAAQSTVDALRLAQQRGWTIRLTLLDSVPLVGRIHAVGDSTVSLSHAQIGIEQILFAERQVRSQRSTLAGSLIGATLGYAAGANVAGYCALGGPDGCDRGRNILVALAGAGGGAIVGGLIASVVAPGEAHWEKLWPQ